MKSGSVKKIVMTIVIVVLCVFVIAILIFFKVGSENADGISESYNGLVQTSKDSTTSKKLVFLAQYALETGDLTIFQDVGLTNTEQEAQEIVDNNTNQNTNSPVTTVTEDDKREIAKAIASQFKCHDLTKQTSKHTAVGAYEYSWGFIEGSKSYVYCNPATSLPIEVNGKTLTTLHRDCSCFSSAFIYLAGYTSNWVHYSSSAGWNGNDVFSSLNTYGDLRVGDVLRKDGHVASVTAIIDETIYVGDCGSTEGIEETAKNGYRYTYNANDKFNTKGPFTWNKVFRYANN